MLCFSLCFLKGSTATEILTDCIVRTVRLSHPAEGCFAKYYPQPDNTHIELVFNTIQLRACSANTTLRSHM